MKACTLCRTQTAHDKLDRISGIDVCSNCRNTDPAESLAALGIPVEWDTQLMRFCAGLGLPGQDPNFYLKCVPELSFHKLVKVVSSEVEVGEPAFDRQIYVRTSDPVRAEQVLANEGVQSALLALLTGVRVNELVGNHVTLMGPTLTVSTRPLETMTPERIEDLKLETAALALCLCTRNAT